MSDIESLRAVYLGTDGSPSRFRVWEEGGALGDSVTPSTFSDAYRQWMSDLLRKFLNDSDAPALLSVGCGNAAVEADLVSSGYRVLGVDALEEAVTLAKDKGVDAVCADVMTWRPPPGWGVVYADGVLGHLYDRGQGILPALERLRSWMPHGAVLVISNDGPAGDATVEKHPGVPGFTWLSGRYLHAQVEAAGFTDVWNTWFTYERPLSGPRDRVVVTASCQPGEGAHEDHR